MRIKYNPQEFEDDIYQSWIDSGLLSPTVDSNKTPFVITMPPPNITGQLHMGHALNNSLQDAIIRYKRMCGFNALYLPGTDHASIATELKIVEQLKAEGKTKADIGRANFLTKAYEWKSTYGGKIVEQLKKLGISCDWNREAFTMDEQCSTAVKYVFVKMYNDGLIYQGDRIINWCIDCKTAISDAEVEYEPNEGNLWHIQYPYTDGTGFLTVATTRPETMLGDVAVAVNPNDTRYKNVIGKTLQLPLTNRQIPIVADDFVDAKFGSGAVKITPAHDPNDFALGARHQLPIIKVMDDDGVINCEPCKGMTRYEARDFVIHEFKKQGLLAKIDKHDNSVGHCYRCHTVVEPLISKQWFVKMSDLAKDAIQVVNQNKIQFLPKQYTKIYLHWMNNIKDWCISRGLWWGHRIPVYYCDNPQCNHTLVTADAPISQCPKCGSTIHQDDGVLDTWFSSALWPFSTLGYPQKSPDLDYFYPSNVLVTAYDIIFFWVARMIFSGLYHTQKVPFDKVLIHGIVRDEQGRKMSKSLGNGIDPLEIIKEYGADSLRYSLLSGISEGSDIRYSQSKLEGSQNFLNKIFNASKFVLMNIDGLSIVPIQKCKLSISDKWILTKLALATTQINTNFDKYRVGQAITVLYDFVWDDFCDWYIEVAKAGIYNTDNTKRQNTASILIYLLDNILRLLHPIVPFITEEIYKDISPHSFDKKDNEDPKQNLIISKSYPNKLKTYKKEASEFEQIINLIKGIRILRKELNLPPSKKIDIYIETNDSNHTKMVSNNLEVIQRLVGVQKIIFDKNTDNAAQTLTNIGIIKILLEGNIDWQAETARITKELQTAQAELARAINKINNIGFISKAPKDLIDNEKSKIDIYQQKVNKLQLDLDNLKRI